MQIDNVKVCQPITNIVELLQNNKFEIIETKVNDYHFHEVYIKMQGDFNDLPNEIMIEKIKSANENSFYCECHWSFIDMNKEAPF